jgi:signal transduction histidine kinase
MANQLFHAIFSGSFAVIAGALADREKKRQEHADKEHYLAGLGRAAATIVHDLKNPIITIAGFSRRIMQRKGDRDLALQIVMDSAEKMQDIVHGALDFAKPVKLDLKHEDICNIMRSAYKLCNERAQQAGIRILERIPAEPVMCAVDGAHLERALVNLISNAVEASKEGDAIIVSAKAEDKIFCITVKDSGEGMDRKTLENIFIPFYTSKSSGTGLGMAITKKVIQAHKGKIKINSKPGQGTEVEVEVPQCIQ